MKTKQGPGEPGGWPRRKGVDQEQPGLPGTSPPLKQSKFPKRPASGQRVTNKKEARVLRI